MHVTITATADDAGELRALREWLGRDRDVARHATFQTQRPQPAGTMGSLEIIDLVLTQGIALGQLALAYAAWRRSRPSAPPLTITVNGTALVVADASPETVEKIAALASRTTTES